MATIDFGKALQDAKGASFEPLPVGDYDVEVNKAEAVTSQNGKPMIKTTFRVVSGPYERRPIINQFVLSVENPQAVAIFFRHMKAFGLTEEWFASLGQQQSLEPVASALVNRRARLSIGHREWQGEMRNEVKAVKPYTGAPQAMAPVGPGGPTPGPVAPVPGPVTPPAPPTATTPPAAPPLPTPTSPQVQATPQPPATPAPVGAVPTSPGAYQESTPSPSAPTDATSDAVASTQPTPPALPL